MSAGICFEGRDCRARCGRCRVKLHRIHKTHDDITDEEFEAAVQWSRDTQTDLTQTSLNRYVHETLRRRNAPFEPEDNRGTVRVYGADMPRLKRIAAARSQSIPALIRDLLDTVEG